MSPAGVRSLAVDVFLPEPLGRDPIVCCCVPGGGMSRGYFDIEAPAALGNFSMARHLVDRGFIVVTLDPPGVGESDVPDDGYTLTPDVVADVNALISAVRYQSIENAPLLIFAAAGAVLVAFMLRT